jgi:hypothetical protein
MLTLCVISLKRAEKFCFPKLICKRKQREKEDAWSFCIAKLFSEIKTFFDSLGFL